MRPLDGLAAEVRERGWHDQRDAVRVAEELLCTFPYGIPSFDEFDAALAPFVNELDVDQGGAIKASVWGALPDEHRAPAWQQLAKKINADPRSRPRSVAEEHDSLEAAA